MKSSAISRRTLLQGAGGGILSLLLLDLHEQSAGALPQQFSPGIMAKLGGSAVGSSATTGDLLQLPLLGDAAGWGKPEYYETLQAGRRQFPKTIQSADIDGDGRDELLIRGASGVLINRFAPELGQWIQLSDGPALKDGTPDNWDLPQHRQTMQTADIDGDGRAELLIKSPNDVQVYQYVKPSEDNPSGIWNSLSRLTDLADGSGWYKPEYYSTIQCADIDGDKQAELLARSSTGILCFKYDNDTNSWGKPFAGPALADPVWANPQYYHTIQCADIDRDGQTELLARGPAGLVTFKYNKVTAKWSQIGTLLDLSDDLGWNAPWAYGSLQTADIDGDGAAELLGLTPSIHEPDNTVGLSFWKFNGAEWVSLASLPQWTDIGPSDPNFPTYETIQCADINGDGAAELLVRDPQGVHAFQYYTVENKWFELEGIPAWSDANNWHQVQYYSTIQTARVLKPDDAGYTGDGAHVQSVLLGRASTAVQTLLFNHAIPEWKNPSAQLPAFSGDAQVAYNHITFALGIQGTGIYGIRARYNDKAAPLDEWISDLLGTGPIPVSPPMNNPEWETVRRQIINELLWVIAVKSWYGDSRVQQIIVSFLDKGVLLHDIGQLLQYQDSDAVSIFLNIEALFENMASYIASLVGLGILSAVYGIISTAFSAAAQFQPNHGNGVMTQYNMLKDQLDNCFLDAQSSLMQNQSTIIGGASGDANIYTPADYGLLSAMGQMIRSTIWDWPDPNDLTDITQRAYAIEVFKILFAAYEAGADRYNYWGQVEDSNPSYTPPDYPVPSALYKLDQPYRWISLWYNTSMYPTDTLQKVFGPTVEGHVFPLGAYAPDLYLAQNGWPEIDMTSASNLAKSPPLTSKPPRPTLQPDLRVTATLSRHAVTNEIVAALTVKNFGMTAATNVEVLETLLSERQPTVAVSPRRMRLVHGRSHTHTVRFPSRPHGTTALLKVSGRYKGGTFDAKIILKLP